MGYSDFKITTVPPTSDILISEGYLLYTNENGECNEYYIKWYSCYEDIISTSNKKEYSGILFIIIRKDKDSGNTEYFYAKDGLSYLEIPKLPPPQFNASKLYSEIIK